MKKARIKLWWIRTLIKFADRAEERLHDWQVSLRGELDPKKFAAVEHSGSPRHTPAIRPLAAGETFQQWEARRSGVAPVSKKEARRRRERVTAGAFDLRYAR